MIPDMIHTPYIAPRISVMAPPPVTAERFVDELLMDGIILLLLALVLIYTVGLGGDDDNHWNRGGGCFA